MANIGFDALITLINYLFDFYIAILLIRLMLSYIHADYYHPLTQFVLTLSNFVINPMKKFIPNVRGVEIAALVLILFIEAIKFILIILLSSGVPHILGLLFLIVGDTLRLILQMLSFSFLLQAILSWVQPHSPAYPFLARLNSPISRPLHRVIPFVSGIDITPIVAIIILQLLVILIAQPLIMLGFSINNMMVVS